MKYICNFCDFEYDESIGYPDSDIAAGTLWQDLPSDFVCPICGTGKDNFTKMI